jgi:cell division protein ZapA
MKQIEVTILGQGYVLGCPEGGEALLHAAVASVDQEMSAIRDGNKVKARERIAVLAALNLAYRLAERGTPPAADAPAAPAGKHDADDDIDVDALLQRIDAVLGNDNHLL